MQLRDFSPLFFGWAVAASSSAQWSCRAAKAYLDRLCTRNN